MSGTPHIPEKEREALLAALQSPTHTLRRMRGGYVALGADVRTSGKATAYTVTRRMALRLERRGLVDFDQPEFPNVVTLNANGVALATRLRDGAPAKAGAA